MSSRLSGKLVSQKEIKSNGDVFHQLFKYRPHEISSISSEKIHGCELLAGDWGAVGSIISWTFTHDGKKKVAKEKIEAIDEENKTIKLKVIGGDLMELYKSITFTIHVDTKGAKNLVNFTVEYEKKNESIPDPQSWVDFFNDLTKDIETHHLNHP